MIDIADKIRGITIEIGGDTKGLTKALKGVNSDISSTQKQLKDVEKLLKLDPTNTELLAQKQKLLKDAVSETNSKLDELKKFQQTMDDNGVDKNSEQYTALQREIISTEKSLKDLETAASKSNVALSKISATADKISQGAGKIASATKGMSTAAAGALGAFGGIAVNAAANADELNTLAQQTGFTTAELQKMQYASDLVDVSMETITGASKKLTKQLSSSESKFSDLGVTTRNADGSFRSTNDIFFDTVNALSRIDNETERDIAAMDIFGKSSAELAGIIDDGGKAFKEYGKQAETAGLILSQETLDSLNKVNDQIDTLKANAKGTIAKSGAKAMEALTPALDRVINALGKVLEYIGNLDSEAIQSTITVLAVIASISPLFTLISKISGAISVLTGTVLPALGTAIQWIAANPISLVIAAIVALVALIGTKGDEIQAILQKVDDFLQNIFATDFTEIFGPVLGNILNAFMANVKNIWDNIKKIFDGVIDFIRGVFTGDWKRAWEGVKEIFSGIFGSLVSIAKVPINGIIGLLNMAIDALNGFIGMVNGVLGRFGAAIGTVGHIPYLAKGGVLSQGSAVVGEAGPELLTMMGNKAVVQPLTSTNSNTPAGTATMGDIKITVQSVLDGKVIGESVTNYQRGRARAYGV